MGSPTISVVIPARDEERTIIEVVESVISWGIARDIIIVNDGSTDGTAKSLKQYKEKISVVTLTENHGKSYAVFEGIKRCNGNLVMILDADLVGMNKKALSIFLKEFVRTRADMAVGITKTWGLGHQRVYYPFHGQRIVRRKDILALHKKHWPSGYGLEVFLNVMYRNKRIFYIPLPGVWNKKKMEKYGFFQTIVPGITEFFDVFTQYVYFRFIAR